MLAPYDNTAFLTALHGWIQQHMWPRNTKITRVPAAILILQERDMSGNVHKFTWGRGLFEVFGTYDQGVNQINNVSIRFIVPYGNILLAEKVTGSLDTPLRITIQTAIKGFIDLYRHENEVHMKYELTTPIYVLSDCVSLFPSGSSLIATKEWYKDVPVMEESTIALIKATPNSPVNLFGSTSKDGYEYAELKDNSCNNQKNDELLNTLFDEYATPRALPAEQKIIGLWFLHFFKLDGTFNRNDLSINAVLSIFITLTGTVQTCRIMGSVQGVGVTVTLGEPLIEGSLNVSCKSEGEGNVVGITLKLDIALIGMVEETFCKLFQF